MSDGVQPQPGVDNQNAAVRMGAGLRSLFRAVPPTGLVLMSVISTQIGAALAKGLFPALGAAGTVCLRVGFAALILFLVWRPRVRGYARAAYIYSGLFGLSLAFMNLCFYCALARIPLGVAVTLEFVGPLGVAIAGSRRWLDILWVVFAAAGIVLLAPVTGAVFNAAGVGLALLAGVCWAAYILCSARVGRTVPGVSGLAMAMVVASAVLLPIGIAHAGDQLRHLPYLAAGLGVALLSSVIPYSLEMEALRRLPTRVFGLLLSTEPAIAALVGFVFLGEHVGLRSIFAIALITAATVGATKGNAAV